VRAAEGPPALSLRGVSKHFGGVQALSDADLTILGGEVHGLLGENGSGKSTLIKILAGFHAPDSGTLEFEGRTVPLPLPPGRFRELGISFVHQDLALIPTLTVVENLRAGLIARAGWTRSLSWRRETRRATAVFARYGVRIDPSATVADLRPVDRALLAIVRAIEEVREEHEGPGILVLDEPTVFLPRSEVDHLFGLVREVAASGGSVLFVSHDLAEIGEITDRVTVLRDGRVVGTAVSAETDEAQLVEMIIGRRLSVFNSAHRDHTEGARVVSVTGLSGPGVDDASLQIREGEVLGLTGLAGSGFESVPYLLTGAWPARAGTLTLDGRDHDVTRMTPGLAVKARVALIPGDRQRDGAVGSLSVTDNVTLPGLPRFRERGVLRRDRMHRHAAAAMEEFDVRPPEPRREYGSFSGGNQQKSLLAKWLGTAPRLLLLHEPTQGVDVGARQQIFATIRGVADRGTCMICASSDHEQLAQICDRVLVFGRGRIISELTGDDVVKDRITEQCYAVAETRNPA
jgi:ribose transport system ATP-binding protein